MSAYNTQINAARDKLLRSASAGGTTTAITATGPMIYNELWATGTIDTTNLWQTTVAATGTVSTLTAGSLRVVRLNCPAGADQARFGGQRKIVTPISPGTNYLYTRLTMEWSAILVNVANHENANFIMGMGDEAAGATIDHRGANDALGFILVSDALNTLTDSGGTETVTVVPSAPTLTNYNRYKIVIENGSVQFYVNKVLEVTHTTNIPALPLKINFVVISEAAVAAELRIGPLRCWLED